MVQAELYEQQAEAFLQFCDFQLAMLNFRKVLMLLPAQEQPCSPGPCLDLKVSHRSPPSAGGPSLWPG